MYLKIFYLVIGVTITYAQDGYIFKNSIQNQYFDSESIIEQTFGPFTILTNFSARKSTPSQKPIYLQNSIIVNFFPKNQCLQN